MKMGTSVLNKVQSLMIIGLIICFNVTSFSQSNPQALKPGIQIQRLLTVQNGAIRLVMDSVENNILYATTNGNIYKVIAPSGSAAYDSLIFTTADHGVQYLQGMDIHDSTLYISGNNDSNTPMTTGIIVRGKLSTGGSRVWSQVMITDPYETGDYFDHLFSGMIVSPQGDSIYICSGARGDHGEVQDRYGLYPDLRNLPLTTNIYIVPTNDPAVIVLKNDSVWHDTSVYVYCKGIRNTFDMAFDPSGNLFGVENSGDRDHHEEMNWLRRGYHYGFPWIMGDTDNPQQFPSYVPANDIMISHYSRSWRTGFWNNDPTFPIPPSGVTFQEPIQNYGPDCDKFRDSITGNVVDASDIGMHIGTFTAHRSPLGLVFDRNNLLHQTYRGDAFMLSWSEGLDSCGCKALPDSGIGPFVDPSQDLVHLELAFDSTIDNFRLNAHRIVESFSHPVDAAISTNRIYVLENGYGGTSGLYSVDLPIPQPCQIQFEVEYSDSCFLMPAWLSIENMGIDSLDINLFDSGGSLLNTWSDFIGTDSISIDSAGVYYFLSSNSFGCSDSISLMLNESLMLTIDSTRAASCIGCTDGTIYFHVENGIGALSYSSTPTVGVFSSDSLSSVPAGSYLICITDSNSCQKCDSATVIEPPNAIKNANKPINNFSLHPNPASDKLIIAFDNPSKKDYTIAITDLLGKRIPFSFMERINHNGREQVSIDTNSLSKGIYVLTIFTVDQSTHTERFTIRR